MKFFLFFLIFNSFAFSILADGKFYLNKETFLECEFSYVTMGSGSGLSAIKRSGKFQSFHHIYNTLQILKTSKNYEKWKESGVEQLFKDQHHTFVFYKPNKYYLLKQYKDIVDVIFYEKGMKPENIPENLSEQEELSYLSDILMNRDLVSYTGDNSEFLKMNFGVSDYTTWDVLDSISINRSNLDVKNIDGECKLIDGQHFEKKYQDFLAEREQSKQDNKDSFKI